MDFEESLKGKILDGRRCICVICKKEGKFGAISFDKETGEPSVLCLDCDLEIIAQRDGITKKEAKKRHKRALDVFHLFHSMKVNEYLEQKGRKEFLSITEANKVLEKIKNAWNSFSPEERRGFDFKSDEELEKIYKKIKIDFPDIQRRSWWSAK